MLLERDRQDTAAVTLTDSRPAVIQVLEADMPVSRSGHDGRSLVAKLHTATSRGCEVTLHWLHSHWGIEGNDEADTLAKVAHDPSTPMCTPSTLPMGHGLRSIR